MRRSRSSLWQYWGIIAGLVYLFGLVFVSARLIPYLDSNFDFIQSQKFHDVGLASVAGEYSGNLHPPLKNILLSGLYTLFSDRLLAYRLFPLLFFPLALFSFWQLVWRVWQSKAAANFSTLILATSPLFVINGTQGMTDFIIASLLLLAIYALVTGKDTLLSLALTAGVLTKETFLVFIPIFFFFYLHQHWRRMQMRKSLLSLALVIGVPILVFVTWKMLLAIYGFNSWQQYVFDNPQKLDLGVLILKNLVLLKIFNPYLVENLKHLLILNFHWLISLSILLLVVRVFNGRVRLKRELILVILLVVGYGLLVLSFPTFTIPRYVLPALVLLYLVLPGAFNWRRQYSLFIAASFIVINLVSSVTSVDPVSYFLWEGQDGPGRIRVFTEKLYNLDPKLSGNDRITYNLQYLKILAARRVVLDSIQPGESKVMSSDCLWLSRDPANDLYTYNFIFNQELEKLPECLLIQ